MFSIGDLHPYYMYMFVVFAVTVETGPPSLDHTVRTLQDGMCIERIRTGWLVYRTMGEIFRTRTCRKLGQTSVGQGFNSFSITYISALSNAYRSSEI